MATTALGLTEKQRALRTTGIGASEVAALAGLHPTKKPIDVYLEKVGDAEPFEGNEFTEWGHRIERVVGEAWQDRHPDLSIFTPGTLRHRDPRYPFALASPDRIVVPKGRRAREAWLSLLEIKNVSVFRADDFGAAGTDEIPEHMLAQVQYQLEIADLAEGELVPLIGGHDFRAYPVKRDREAGGMLLEIVARFWTDHVVPRVPPPVDGSKAYASFLRKRFPNATGPVLEPTDDLRALVARLREAKAASKAAEEAEALAANQLRAALGEAEGVSGLVTYRMQKGSTYTVTREAGRVLRLTKEKGV